MIIFTVFDAIAGEQYAFPVKRHAVECADDCAPGTEVMRVDIGRITRQVACNLIMQQSYAITERVVYRSGEAPQ